MSLSLTLDRKATRPLYQQLVQQIKSQIGDGRLPQGTRLPPVRQLAEELGVTRLTVHSAYSELQAEGWVEATVGRGTFVRQGPAERALLTSLGRQITPDGVIADEPRIAQIPTLRSLAYANPDPALCPVEPFWACLASLEGEARTLLQYGPSQGDATLRVAVADLLHERAIECLPDDLLITSGATGALSLITQALTQPGDSVAVEAPTYLGMLSILTSRGVRPLSVPLDDEGPRLDALEQLVVQQRPRFFYTIPTFHNPTGICMSAARRQALLALADQYGLIVVEDEVYGRLHYDVPPPSSLKAQDRLGRVIYVDSISKTLLPGLRIGYVVAPPALQERLLSLRRATDLCGPLLVQRALALFLHERRHKAHLRRVLPLYRERRDALLHGLRRSMPEGVQWTEPSGGFCCWVTLPPTARVGDLYQAALERGVAYTPGEVFLAEGGSPRALRLCFGNQPPEVIRESLAVLGELIHTRLARGPARRERRAFDGVPLV